MAYTLNDTPIAYGTPFKSGEYKYTKAWWRTSSDSEKTAVGIKTVADPTPYDERFYWSKDNPKDITQLKERWINEQKDTANKLLVNTDWIVVRKAEAGTAIPSDTTTYRTAVRTVCKEREDQITACSNTAALKTLVDTSPTIPGTASNGATERKKEVFNSDGSSKDPKEYESYDPKQWNDIANPAALKAWPEMD